MKAAPNPILGSERFVPDVEAHVWEDGRMYLYGSYDIRGKRGYCSDRYHVFSSDDLETWTDHGVAFSLADTAWAKEMDALYAPDCAYRDGVYYLYYCVPDGRCDVAKSTSPCGPFVDIGPIEHVMGIDPAVLMDDDGAAYLYWGQFDKVRVARLKDNMTEIDPATITQPLSVAEHEFHEGSSVKKICGRYYYLFTDTHRHGGRATCLGWAVSDNPMTGFKYGGVVIDNYGCDPATWNNHGSLVCWQGQWYVFYHRSTHGCGFSRWACVEPIEFDENGRILEAHMTTAGLAGVLQADGRMPAWRACELVGRARIETDAAAADGLALKKICPGDRALYRSLAFEGETSFTIRLKADGMCRVEIYADDGYWGCLTTRASEVYATYSAVFPPLHGTHEISLRFYGEFESAAMEAFCVSE